jgi:hypothetical protein
MNTAVRTSTQTNRAGRRAASRRAGALGATGVIAVGGAGALLAAFAGSAGAAATILVDSGSDGAANAANCTDGTPGNCTLRDAALLAADGDTINFSVSNITLTNGTVNFDAVNIIGPGSSALTVTTAGLPGAYEAFMIGGTGDVLISGITVTQNRIKAENVGTLTLDDVTVSGSTGDYGGALYADSVGDLVIRNSNFEGNTSSDAGGAIYVYSEFDVTISNTSVTGNTSGSGGGGIYVSEGAGEINISDSVFDSNTSNNADCGGGGACLNGTGVTIDRSTFSNNISSTWGGGLYISEFVRDVVISDSEISGNTSADGGGGALLNASGNVTVLRTTVEDNDTAGSGGGLFFGQLTDVNTVTDSLISGNTALGGGGIFFYGSEATVSYVNNSTFAGNQAYVGGGLASTRTVTINQSTISQNSALVRGGGLFTYTTMNLSGTVVSGNSASENADIDTSVTTVNATHSILGDISEETVLVGSNNIMTMDPMVAALADNGGPTRTMALLAGSPAIDAGPNPVASFVGNEFDQRGAPWLRVYNGTVDIGAFELQPPPNPGPDDPVVPAFTG